MKIFMIVADKCPNTLTGIMGGRTFELGMPCLFPTGTHKLIEITEGFGKNGKPVVTLVYESGIVQELPDYNIEKYRQYEDEPEGKKAKRNA